MPKNTSAAKARTAKPYSDRPKTEGTEVVGEFARQGASYTKDMYEKTKVAAEETNRLIEQTYSTVAKNAGDFNVQWIEMVRASTNSALDFSRDLVGVKSPSEFLELSAAHARKQFEILTEQAPQLASMLQKGTRDAVQAGVKNAFGKAA